MRKVRRWRYYCDFCKRAGGSGGHIARHEAGCTKNPDRVCGMCKHVGLTQLPIAGLVASLRVSLAQLITAANNCPACILAAIRQSGEAAMQYEWSYKDAAEKWWAEVREAEYEKDVRDEHNAMMADECRIESYRSRTRAVPTGGAPHE